MITTKRSKNIVTLNDDEWRKITYLCSERDRDNLMMTSKSLKRVVDETRLDEYSKVWDRSGRWTHEKLPTPIELAERGVDTPNYRNICRFFAKNNISQKMNDGPLANFYARALLLDAAAKEGVSSRIQMGGTYFGGTIQNSPHGFGAYWDACLFAWPGVFRPAVWDFIGHWKDRDADGVGITIKGIGRRADSFYHSTAHFRLEAPKVSVLQVKAPKIFTSEKYYFGVPHGFWNYSRPGFWVGYQNARDDDKTVDQSKFLRSPSDPQGVGGYGYEGFWKEGRRHGRGHLISGRFEYEGELDRGVGEGHGTLKNTQAGWIYSGEWKNGLPHGDGLFWSHKGKGLSGRFVEGRAVAVNIVRLRSNP